MSPGGNRVTFMIWPMLPGLDLHCTDRVHQIATADVGSRGSSSSEFSQRDTGLLQHRPPQKGEGYV